MRLDWHVDEAAWDKARHAVTTNPPGGDYDRTLTPRYDLLHGLVQLSHGGVTLFPGREGINVSLLDLAVQLAEVVPELQPSPEADREPVKITLLDPRVTFRMTREDGDLLVTCDHGHAGHLRVPEGELASGVGAFVTEVVSDIDHKAPGVLGWDSAAPLLGHARPAGSGRSSGAVDPPA